MLCSIDYKIFIYYNLSHMDFYWQEFVTGAVIIIAVLLDIWRVRLRERFSVSKM